MTLPSKTETVVVGGGQAGLAMSHYLGKAGREHIVLERRPTLGGGWQDRWDAFRLVSPNFSASLPGSPYDGPDPDGFMPRDEVVARVAGYAGRIGAPVVRDAEVDRLSGLPGGGFRLHTKQGVIQAKDVVVATGGFHVPKVPAIADHFPAMAQTHSHDYRNVSSLPDGAVLIVGTGQSGVQIAEELVEAGRQVYLSVGSAGRLPRRYRGRDIFRWLAALATEGRSFGFEIPSVDTMPDPRLRLAGNPHLSGHHGGHETNLRRFAAEKRVTLLGRIRRVEGKRLMLAQDVSNNLAQADRFFDERFRSLIDGYIEKAGIDAPPDDREPFAFEPPMPEEVDLALTGISCVVWASGYTRDYSWIDFPIIDEQGFPKQKRGASDVPGLYFLGSLWQHSLASATLFGPAVDGPPLLAQMGLAIGEASAR